MPCNCQYLSPARQEIIKEVFGYTDEQLHLLYITGVCVRCTKDITFTQAKEEEVFSTTALCLSCHKETHRSV
jgi:hypothetical protein